MPTKRRKTQTDIASMARVHTDAMLNVLRHIASSPKAQPGARVAAAMGVLSYGHGRPHQSIAHTGANDGPIVIESKDALELLMGKLGAMALRIPKDTPPESVDPLPFDLPTKLH